MGRWEGGAGGWVGSASCYARNALNGMHSTVFLRTAHQLALLLADNGSLLLGARHNALQRVGDLVLADLLEVAARGEDGGLVHQVLKVSACGRGGGGKRDEATIMRGRQNDWHSQPS